MYIHEANTKSGKLNLINSQPVTFGDFSDNLNKKNWKILKNIWGIIYNGLQNPIPVDCCTLKKRENMNTSILLDLLK